MVGGYRRPVCSTDSGCPARRSWPKQRLRRHRHGSGRTQPGRGRCPEALNPGLPGMRRVDAARLNGTRADREPALMRASAVGLDLDEDVVDSVIDDLRSEANVARKVLVVAGVDPDGHPSVVKGPILSLLDPLHPSSWPRRFGVRPSTDKRWMSKLAESPLVAAAVRMPERSIMTKSAALCA